jgi:N-acetyl-anhydromuramyl-L-alanine amidase AmpD
MGAAHYLVSAEARPKVIKIVQDNGVAGHIAPSADQSWWGGKNDVDRFSIGIETSHKAGTPWPDAQIGRLMGLLEQLLHAYPSIKRHRIVGHNDVLLFGHDCPGLEFDWPMLEKFGLGMVPKNGSFSAEIAYGGFFNLRPSGALRLGDRDDKRVWGGGAPWPAQPASGPPAGAPQTISGEPIKELQTDLREIGYFTPVDGQLGPKTQFALHMFQRHFFAGSRHGLMTDAQLKKREVDRITAEFIKNVRP